MFAAVRTGGKTPAATLNEFGKYLAEHRSSGRSEIYKGKTGGMFRSRNRAKRVLIAICNYAEKLTGGGAWVVIKAAHQRAERHLLPPLSRPTMLLRVLNPSSPPASRSGSTSSTDTDAVPQRATSVRSATSSEEGTLHTQPSMSNIKEEYLPSYSEGGTMSYTRFFEKEKQRISQEFDPYDSINANQRPPLKSPSSSKLRVTQTANQLAAALGPDNVPHSMEIDTIPCAGVRIRHGALSGLLAWRLVIRIPESASTGKWWDEGRGSRRRRRGSMAPVSLLPPPPHKPAHSNSYSEWCPPKSNNLGINRSASLSSTSLPSQQHNTTPLPPTTQDSIPVMPQKPTALVSNFILDTSMPHSVISRETVLRLGYPFSLLPPLSDPNDPSEDSDDAPTVTLSIQGVSTRLRFANPGEPSRLGVQFLQDAGVSVFFPKDGDGVGPVLYRE